MSKYFNLLKSYCDKLIDYQIKEFKDPAFLGGIMCPSCSAIHGRISDAVYPFTALYDITGEEKYINAARGVVDWSEKNVLRPNGSYFNDKPNTWNRTTIFTQIAFGETLIYHKDCLDKYTYEKWLAIFKRQSDFIMTFNIENIRSNINYFISAAASLAIAYKILGDEKYKKHAYEIMDYSANFFAEDGLLFGECVPYPIDYKSPRGCRGIDIGYNCEETIPSMVLFAHYMQDKKYYELAKKYFLAQIEFMIPDGGWDNSWGCRSDKWTYWGSRTSDGCQAALSILANDDPIFAEAAERNFRMYEYCSKDGLLYGGYMYIESGEDGCTHHSFCHAKVLASMIDHGFKYKEEVKLPRDEEYGLKYFPSAHVHLVAKDDWRATVSDNDIVRMEGTAKSGGALTLLWNKKIGPVFAASLPVYTPFEARNMQQSNNLDFMSCITPRIDFNEYSNINERNANVTSDNNKSVVISATGQLTNISYDTNGTYKISYKFENNSVIIIAESSVGGLLRLPVICSFNEKTNCNGCKATVERKGCTIHFEANSDFSLDPSLPEHDFNLVGGFATTPLIVALEANKTVTIKINVQ